MDRDREFVFNYISVSGTLLVLAELAVILIMSKVNISFSIKYMSINFLTSDLLFHLGCASFAVVILLEDELTVCNDFKASRQLVQGFTAIVRFSSVALLSWERVFAIAWPLRYRSSITKYRVILMILLQWIVNIMFYGTAVIMLFTDVIQANDQQTTSDNSRTTSGVNGTQDRISGSRSSDTDDQWNGERFIKQQTTPGEQEWVRGNLATTEKALIVLLGFYELLNISACCCLAVLIRQYVRRQKARFNYLRRIQNIVSDRKTKTASATNGNAFDSADAFMTGKDTSAIVSVISNERVEEEGIGGRERKSIETVEERNSKTKAKPIASLNEMGNSRSDTCKSFSDTSYPVKSCSDIACATSVRDTGSGLKRMDITKLILSIAVLQLCFHVPYIFEIPYVVFGRGNFQLYLTNVSRMLLQIATIPSLYIYVFKLRECRDVFKKLIYFCLRKDT